MKSLLASVLVLSSVLPALAGYPDKKTVSPPEEDRWRFVLAVPGWMAGAEGVVGIHGLNSDIDVRFKDIFNKIDMVWATSVEASKGRFGVMGELIYLSASESLGVGGPLRNFDARLDEYLADFTLRWRILEGERGYVDFLVGVRYTNIYQHVHLQSDNAGVGEASEKVIDDLDDDIRDRLEGVLSDSGFRTALADAVAKRIGDRLNDALGANPRRQNLAMGPVAGRHPLVVTALVEDAIREEEARLRAEVNALEVRGAARAVEVERRINAAKGRMEKRIANILDKELNRSFSKGDDWWDPYVGLRARYNFTSKVYAVARGDIGGFGVGSDLMWQAEAAIGLQLTTNIHAELGYRALSFDYSGNGLTNDTITHGVQLTTGIEF